MLLLINQLYKYNFFQAEQPKITKVQPPAPGEPPKIEVIREKRPSLVPEPASRRGSLVPPAEMGRRPSLIINDEVSKLFILIVHIHICICMYCP